MNKIWRPTVSYIVSRRGLLAGITVATLAISLGVFANPVKAQDKVSKIGLLAPLTGGLAGEGQDMLRGVQLAVEEVNAAGGINGWTFEIVEADVPDQASDVLVSAVERLLDDGNVNYICTSYVSNTNFEIEYMAEVGMPYMLSGGTQQTRDIIAPNPDKYSSVWSVNASYDAYETELVPVVEGLAEAGAISFNYGKKVALISSDNVYSKGIFEGLQRSFSAAGWTVTLTEMLPFGEINDWRAFFAKVRQDPPDLIVNTDYLPNNAATFITQFLEDPTNSLVFIQYAPSVPEFLELTGEKSTGVIYNLIYGFVNTTKHARSVEVMEKYKGRWGNLSGTGISMYEMSMIYFDAVREVGDPTDKAAISKALSATDKDTAGGRIKFDQNTHLAIQGADYLPLQFYQIRDGNQVLFYPDKYATHEFVRPPWMK